MISERENYQIFYNKDWIESLEHKEISHYDVDHLENQWVVYKEKYTTDINHADRLQTQKNRAGTVLLRNKNKPFGFKLTDVSSNDTDNAARKNQANILDSDLRAIFDGNVYEFKLYGNIGVVFGQSGSKFYSIAFNITGTITNTFDEKFVNISVINKTEVSSLYNFIDCLIVESYFYTIIFKFDVDLVFSIIKYNTITNSYEAPLHHIINTTDFDSTSINDLDGLSYPPVSSREIFVATSYEDGLRRIWSTTFRDDEIYLAYECTVPVERSSITGVTEGIVLLKFDFNSMLNITNSLVKSYVFDTVESVAKLQEENICQAFIPDFEDKRKSFGSTMSIEGKALAVGSYKENAIYVFDLNESTTPDVFGTDFPSLPTNGVRIDKNYALESIPVYPIRMNAGTMDFEVFGGTGIKWIRENGDYVVDSRPSIVLSTPETIYLIMDSFKDNVTIDAHQTSEYFGDLSEVPDISFGLKLNDTGVSGYFNDGMSLTDIDIERTQLTQSDLEQCMIVLHEAGNLNGTILAEDAMPEIVTPEAVGAVNSLLAKGWNVSINMGFTDTEPTISIAAELISGDFLTVYTAEDQLAVIGEIFGGVLHSVYIADDAFGTFGSIVTGTLESEVLAETAFTNYLTTDGLVNVVTDIDILETDRIIYYGSIIGKAGESVAFGQGTGSYRERRINITINPDNHLGVGYGGASTYTTVAANSNIHVYDLQYGILRVDGTVLVNSSSGSFTTGGNDVKFELFGINSGWEYEGDFYFCQIFDEANNLKHFLIPQSDTTILDTVTSTTYSSNGANAYTYNSSTETHTTVAEKEYYNPPVSVSNVIIGGEIDIGYPINNDTEWEIRGNFTTTSATSFMGSRDGGSRAYMFGEYNNNFIVGFGGSITTIQAADTNVHTFKKVGQNFIIDSGTPIALNSVTSTTYNGLLFATNLDGSPNYRCEFNLEYAKIWRFGTLVRDYIPQSNGSLLDQVSGTEFLPPSIQLGYQGSTAGVDITPL